VARWLAGRPLEDDDRALLADAYAPDAARILLLEPGVAGLVVPTFRDGTFAWELYAASSLALEVTPHGHGLDELATTRVRARAAPSASAPATAETLARAIAAHQLGLVAIAAGAAERAHALARAYAAQRRQGGKVIDGHAAVLALLGNARAALSGVRLQLEAQGARPLARAELGAVLATRAQAMPALAGAAHAAVQVFGGLGYMRDTGVEKVARDVNVLRAIAGAPPELLLIVAEWERLDG
jgi:alkylation response protein AidB-like acyl-CoA dehydrogenase